MHTQQVNRYVALPSPNLHPEAVLVGKAISFRRKVSRKQNPPLSESLNSQPSQHVSQHPMVWRPTDLRGLHCPECLATTDANAILHRGFFNLHCFIPLVSPIFRNLPKDLLNFNNPSHLLPHSFTHLRLPQRWYLTSFAAHVWKSTARGHLWLQGHPLSLKKDNAWTAICLLQESSDARVFITWSGIIQVKHHLQTVFMALRSELHSDQHQNFGCVAWQLHTKKTLHSKPAFWTWSIAQ